MVIYAQRYEKRSTSTTYNKEVIMSIANEITVTVGTVAIVKIGRNEVEVTVTEVTANGWNSLKIYRREVQWLGFGTFTAGAQVQSLLGELRSASQAA